MREANALSRRTFLSAAGALVVAIATPSEFAKAASVASANGAAKRPPVLPGALSSYISIEPDGTVVAYYGKIDGGQGLETRLHNWWRKKSTSRGSACASSWAIPRSP
jgi:hypothetical protein